ncbi:hypothetical protein D3C75_1339790 [compost metagenome]
MIGELPLLEAQLFDQAFFDQWIQLIFITCNLKIDPLEIFAKFVQLKAEGAFLLLDQLIEIQCA